MLFLMVPGMRNMRPFSFLALVGTTYTAWYMMGMSWANWHPRTVARAARAPPPGVEAFFQAFSNIVFTFGGHCMLMWVGRARVVVCARTDWGLGITDRGGIQARFGRPPAFPAPTGRLPLPPNLHPPCREVVDSQWRASRYPATFASALAYVTLAMTLPSAVFTYLAFPTKVRGGRALFVGTHHPRKGVWSGYAANRAISAARRVAGPPSAHHTLLFTARPCFVARLHWVLRDPGCLDSNKPHLLTTPCSAPRQTLPQSMKHGNAFAIFPNSPAKSVGIVLMVAHQVGGLHLWVVQNGNCNAFQPATPDSCPSHPTTPGRCVCAVRPARVCDVGETDPHPPQAHGRARSVTHPHRWVGWCGWGLSGGLPRGGGYGGGRRGSGMGRPCCKQHTAALSAQMYRQIRPIKTA